MDDLVTKILLFIRNTSNFLFNILAVLCVVVWRITAVDGFLHGDSWNATVGNVQSADVFSQYAQTDKLNSGKKDDGDHE